MRRIALVNQKGGVGKTTTAVNLGAALAERGKRVVLVDLDPQANLSVHVGIEPPPGAPSIYRVLVGECTLADALRPTSTPGLSVVPADLDLSGAELELATQLGRETLLRDALEAWRRTAGGPDGDPADYVLLDCPPSLGLLSVNGLAAADEVLITLQTEFFALRGLSKLVEIVRLVQRRLHPGLRIGGIVPCLYDSRLRLAREVLAELKAHFPDRTLRPVGVNVKLAEAPSYGRTIFEYAPESTGARDYRQLAEDVVAAEAPAPGASVASNAPSAAPERGDAGAVAEDAGGAPAAVPEAAGTGAAGTEAAAASAPADASAGAPAPEEDPLDALARLGALGAADPREDRASAPVPVPAGDDPSAEAPAPERSAPAEDRAQEPDAAAREDLARDDDPAPPRGAPASHGTGPQEHGTASREQGTGPREHEAGPREEDGDAVPEADGGIPGDVVLVPRPRADASDDDAAQERA